MIKIITNTILWIVTLIVVSSCVSRLVDVGNSFIKVYEERQMAQTAAQLQGVLILQDTTRYEYRNCKANRFTGWLTGCERYEIKQQKD